MLYLRTGLPGSGKTLNTIREVERDYGPTPPPGLFWSLCIKFGIVKPAPPREPRDVYYYGIPELQTDKLKARWIEFDTPDKWYELPDGAVIVIDEAQRVFGAQDGRKVARPEHVARFETHRHQGFDIHLITQHPSLIMSHVRRLVGKHINMYRAFGGKRLLRHEYEFCIDKPETRANFKQSQETRVKLDPKYFGVYKSATVHTHKFKLPNYVYMVPVLVGFLLLSGYYVFSLYSGSGRSEPTSGPSGLLSDISQPSGTPIQPDASLAAPQKALHDVAAPETGQGMTPDEYQQWMTPRIPDIPMSAPRYDRLTEPKSFPRLSCVMSRDPDMVESAKRRRLNTASIEGTEFFCQCYTQQTTRYDTTFEFCRSTVENGYFDDTRPDRMTATPGVFNPDRPEPSTTGGVLAPRLSSATGQFNNTTGLRVDVIRASAKNP